MFVTHIDWGSMDCREMRPRGNYRRATKQPIRFANRDETIPSRRSETLWSPIKIDSEIWGSSLPPGTRMHGQLSVKKPQHIWWQVESFSRIAVLASFTVATQQTLGTTRCGNDPPPFAPVQIACSWHYPYVCVSPHLSMACFFFLLRYST